MSFHASAQDIRVDEGHILRARLNNGGGDFVDAELDLNNVIGNNDGTFEWGGKNFAGSAENIHFSVEGNDNVPILRAQLRNIEGDLRDADINLSERIGNNGGSFNFE